MIMRAKEFLREPGGQFRSSVDSFFSGSDDVTARRQHAPPSLGSTSTSTRREQDKKIKGSDGNAGDEEDAIHIF